MSIKEITRDEFDDLLIEEHGFILDLPEDGNFYEILDELTGEQTVCWAENLKISQEEVFSIGLELFRLDKRRAIVSPTLLEFVRDVPRVEISSKKMLDKVTKGKSIKVNKFEKYSGKPILVTFFKHPVAFGTVNEDEFVPLIDVGQYLREGQ